MSTDPSCLACCDLVILALPIPALLQPSSELLEALPAGAVVTDVGSVKQPVLEAWNSRHPRFVASHPMAGTAEAGVEAVSAICSRGAPGLPPLMPKPIPRHWRWWKRSPDDSAAVGSRPPPISTIRRWR